ncbi:hypothetical protein FQA39_LY16863 [Lamprigera yunnana]|nr:hypothetical protein FQA39_LY16863 [Lamprigera yunnana]
MTEKSGSWSPVEIDNLITLVSERRDLTGYRTRRGEKYLPSGSGAKPIKKWVYFDSLMFLEPYMTERNTSTNLKKVSNNTTNRSLCNNVSSQSYAKAYMLNDDGILLSDEAEESDRNTEEYNSQTNPHVDDETYSPSISDAPSTPEGPTSGSRKKRKSKLNPVDERFLTFFEKKHESTVKRKKSSNELFLASLLEDMNKLQQDDLRKFKIIMLTITGEKSSRKPGEWRLRWIKQLEQPNRDFRRQLLYRSAKFGNTMFVLQHVGRFAQKLVHRNDKFAISNIELGAFEGLSGLQFLSLYQNDIGEIESGVFLGLDSLNYLELGNNQIKQITPETLQAVPKLRNLRLTGNNLILANDTSANCPQLLHLDFSDNNIDNLPADVSKRPTFKNKNNVETLTSDNFADMIGLKYLMYLQNNNIKTIEPGAFKTLESLLELYLDDNKVTTLEPRCVPFQVENNCIENLNLEIFSELPALKFVSFEGNPLSEEIPEIMTKYSERTTQTYTTCC